MDPVRLTDWWAWLWPVLDWFLCGAGVAFLWAAIVRAWFASLPGAWRLAALYVWWRALLWRVILEAYDGRL